MDSNPNLKKQNMNGIWFFGLAGSGKTLASKVCAKFVDNAFIIDGDEVRKFISFDLGYSLKDRHIQISRMHGLAQIAKINCQFPIVSTVMMTDEIFQKCVHGGIAVVQIERPMDQLCGVRKIYDTGSNVVGQSIQQIQLNTVKIFNNGDNKFEKELEEFVK